MIDWKQRSQDVHVDFRLVRPIQSRISLRASDVRPHVDEAVTDQPLTDLHDVSLPPLIAGPRHLRQLLRRCSHPQMLDRAQAMRRARKSTEKSPALTRSTSCRYVVLAWSVAIPKSSESGAGGASPTSGSMFTEPMICLHSAW